MLISVCISQCLKITQKSSIWHCASEASYVYILSGQNFIKNAKKGQFWRIFEKCDFLRNFQTLCNISLSRLVGTWTGSRPTFYGKALYNTHPIRQKALEEVGSNPAWDLLSLFSLFCCHFASHLIYPSMNPIKAIKRELLML